jgi:hypothetical protein
MTWTWTWMRSARVSEGARDNEMSGGIAGMRKRLLAPGGWVGGGGEGGVGARRLRKARGDGVRWTGML